MTTPEREDDGPKGRLSFSGEPQTRFGVGFFTPDGRLVVNAVDRHGEVWTICWRCGKERCCGWYTGYGPTIRWYCQPCVGKSNRRRSFGSELIVPWGERIEVLPS